MKLTKDRISKLIVPSVFVLAFGALVFVTESREQERKIKKVEYDKALTELKDLSSRQRYLDQTIRNIEFAYPLMKEVHQKSYGDSLIDYRNEKASLDSLLPYKQQEMSRLYRESRPITHTSF